MPPKYDFAAADRLSQQLSQLIDKLERFIQLRKGQRGALLGNCPGAKWQGAKRDEFDTDFTHQQKALTALKAAARGVQSQVAQETAAAHAAQKTKQ
ncbi:hypothetical protein ACWGMA_11600 [Streptomyces asiaticus]